MAVVIGQIDFKDDLKLNLFRKAPKKIYVNESILKKQSEIKNYIRSVCFCSNDIEIVRSEPSYRRTWIDKVVSQLEPVYLDLISRFNRLLKQRSHFWRSESLSKIQSLDIVESFDIQMSIISTRIFRRRRRALLKIKPYVEYWHNHLSKSQEQIDINYLSGIQNISPEEEEEEVISNKIAEQLLKQRSIEALTGKCNFGPHRDDIEFSCEDASRSDPDFLYEVIQLAISAGATTINIPDTVGFTTPSEFGKLIADINKNVPNIDEAVISVHGHNDLGLAVAYFLEAVKNGARQLECTINGIGERAGNASLEELVMALHVRKSFFNSFFKRNPDSPTPLTAIRTEEITKTSRLVSNLTGMTVQPNKAIVGANAFAHESGIHQDGVLKNRLTYEIIDAKTVGLSDNKISLGKLSGRSAVRARLEEMSYDLSREDLNDAFARFKDLADM